MTIHLLRHGEVYNPDGVLYGRLSGYGLSELGQAMAERIREALQGRDIRYVIASPLQRAQETAAPTAAAFSLPLGTDEGLIEAGNDFEGTQVNQRRHLAHPRFWHRYTNPLRPSWGEPYEEQVKRMTAVINDTRRLLQQPGQDEQAGHREQPGHDKPPGQGEALLVSHQLPIWVTRLHLERRRLWHDPRRRQCSLASLTSLTFVGSRLVGLSYCEPAADLLDRARDFMPGSAAAEAGAGMPAAGSASVPAEGGDEG